MNPGNRKLYHGKVILAVRFSPAQSEAFENERYNCKMERSEFVRHLMFCYYFDRMAKGMITREEFRIAAAPFAAPPRLAPMPLRKHD
jgi:hypothetical protein